MILVMDATQVSAVGTIHIVTRGEALSDSERRNLGTCKTHSNKVP